ncbi:Holliday junction branch migration protein RuvA [Aestuariibius insulae]|uniref:Holliday junction branch migration protein RuvA n=1 Tax=Aestuariibius insulae TaxID=2058287 RepID=UPI00345E42AF
MIGRLSGRLDYRFDDHVLIDVGGVGYIVYVSDRTRMSLPETGQAVSLFTDLLVREDLLQLFGFSSLVEKEWHRLLMGVQGIGAKASMAILGAIGPEGVGQAIALGDWSSIAVAKGVGPKTAQRVVNELKDKAPGVMAMATGPAAPHPSTDVLVEAASPPTPQTDAAAQAEALSALGNLGYTPADATRAIAEVLVEEPDAGTSDLIRAALRRLAPKS